MNRRSFLGALVALAASPLLPSKVTPDTSSLWMVGWDVEGPFKIGPANLSRISPGHLTTIRTALPPTYWRALNTYTQHPMLAHNELLDDLEYLEAE
jgi:hypothetical protein